MKCRGSAYLETIAVIPIFLFLFLSISYFGMGYYISQGISEISKQCLWFQIRRSKVCEGEFEIQEKNPPLIGNYSTGAEVLNYLSGLKGIEVVKEYKMVGFSDLKISSFNYSELESWTSDTKIGKFIGYGLVLMGFIMGFSGGSEKIEGIGKAFLPEGFDISKAERILNGMGK